MHLIYSILLLFSAFAMASTEVKEE